VLVPALTPQKTPVDQIADWLMEQALAERDLDEVVLGCCGHLSKAGVPLVRGFFAFSVLHPLHRAVGITWTRGTGVKVDDYPHAPGGVSDAYRESPFGFMEEHKRDVLRCRLVGDAAIDDFPIFDSLREQGMTDYLAFRIPFDERHDIGMAGSWATDREGGFTDEDVGALVRIQRRLAVASKMAVKSALMRNLTDTYLGRVSGRHVLSGQIRRGDGQSVKAAIWYADLRDSTGMADHVPRQDYIGTLNAFFDAAGGSVHDAGGQILNFIGDSVLAIFPTEEGIETPEKACTKALAAATDAQDRLARLNAERQSGGLAPLGYGIGLHVGEVMYGNVGTQTRLTFSAFGAAVNEVVRIEQLTKSSGERVLASLLFAAATQAEWRPVGEFTLRGIDAPMQVLAPE
jgi:adenylate cyclase